jgi:hypothetical protein
MDSIRRTEMLPNDFSTAVKFFFAGVGIGALLAIICAPPAERLTIPSAVQTTHFSQPAA